LLLKGEIFKEPVVFCLVVHNGLVL
jgi:hypothetical protein